MRLGKHGPYDARFDDQPHAVQHVVSPAHGIEGDGVDICVEEVAEAADELLECEALRALREGEEFDDVRVGQGAEANVVES